MALWGLDLFLVVLRNMVWGYFLFVCGLWVVCGVVWLWRARYSDALTL